MRRHEPKCLFIGHSDDRLIDDAELLLDVVEVSADSRRGEVQVLRNPLHGRTARETDEYLELALRKALDDALARAS